MIALANVALPFAVAWARRVGDAALERDGLALYAGLPGLASNAITREMTRQLGMARQPVGACAQQGLQHIWARWCQRKLCAGCLCGGAGAARACERGE